MEQLVFIGLCNWILTNVTKCNTKYKIVKLWIAPGISNLAYDIVALMAPFSNEIDSNLPKGLHNIFTEYYINFSPMNTI